MVRFSHQIASSSVQKCAVRCLSYVLVSATYVFLLSALRQDRTGALNESVISEIVQWHNQKQGAGVRGSRLKLGVLAGTSIDSHNIHSVA